MREQLHFNTNATGIGTGHVILTDHGTYWSGEIIVATHLGEVVGQFTRTFARDVFAHQIIEALVAEYNKGDAS